MDTVGAEQRVPLGANYSIGTDFLGVGNGFPNYSVPDAPPDTNMAVGDTQIVQWVNVSYTVCDKTHDGAADQPSRAIRFGAASAEFAPPTTTVTPSRSGTCRHIAGCSPRTYSSSPYNVCVAISQTNDANGTYYLYQFPVVNNGFPDYPKWGIWPHNYGQTWNNFGPGGSGFVGPVFCVYNRAKTAGGRPDG